MSISIYVYIYLSMSISIYVYIYLCLYLSMSISIYVYIYLCLYLSIYLSIYLSVYYLCTYLYLSIHPSIHLPLSQPIIICSHHPKSSPSSHYNRKEGLTCGVFWSFSSSFLIIFFHTYFIIEGSLEVKLPTIWTDEKHRWEESEKRREEKKK